MSVPDPMEPVKEPVERTLLSFLSDQRADMAVVEPEAALLIEELERVVRSGGKRLRPAFCYWGYRAADGAPGDEIFRVAAALELFHTFALIHDDVMDEAETRRGAPTTRARFSKEEGSEAQGTAAAIVVGDLALVLADQLFMESGFPADLLRAGFQRFSRMRVTLAAGQFLDLVESGRPVSEERSRRIAFLKSGEYTVEGPLHIGAILGGASEKVISALSRYGRPLGEAFQVRDDLAAAIRGESDLAQGRPTFVLAAARDRANEKDRRFLQDHVGGADLTPSQRGELREILHRSGAVEEADRVVSHLVDEALGALEDAHLPPEAARALRALGALIAGTTT